MKDEILHRYLYGQVTEEEKQQVLEWLDAAPEAHTAELGRLHYLCSAVDHYNLQRRSSRIDGWSLRRVSRYAVGIAASVALLFGVWHISHLNAYKDISSRVAVLSTSAGEHLKVTLEDGTTVWLNAQTVLEYPPVFEKGIRAVKLSGEAMFEVQHDAKRPFVVETFSSKIEVLGTKFNVLADKERNQFMTTLVEGRVKVTNLLNPSEILMMQPYDVVELIGGSLCKKQTADFRDLCWTEGLLRIKKMPFDELMARFEKAYDVKIVYNRSTLPQINVQSGEIRISDGVDYALHVLQQVADFTYERDEAQNVIVIR